LIWAAAIPIVLCRDRNCHYGVDDLPGSDHRAIHARLSRPEAG
jgi:hypothetical protein